MVEERKEEKISSDNAVLSETPTPTPTQPPTQVPEEFMELQSELIKLNTKLVFAVATCDCRERDSCEVFENAKEIAKILKKMQDMITITTRQRGRGKKR